MSWLKTVGGLFTGKAVETTAETVRETARASLSIIDEAFHTDEEKGQLKLDTLNIMLKLQDSLDNENHGTSQARRDLMRSLTRIIAFTFLLCVVLVIFKQSAMVSSITDLVVAFKIGWAWVAGVTLYFSTHIVSAAKS